MQAPFSNFRPPWPQTTGLSTAANGSRIWTRNKLGLVLLNKPAKRNIAPRPAGRHPNKPGGLKWQWSQLSSSDKTAWRTYALMYTSYTSRGTPFSLSGYQMYLRQLACERLFLGTPSQQWPTDPNASGPYYCTAGFIPGFDWSVIATTTNTFPDPAVYLWFRVSQPFPSHLANPPARLKRLYSIAWFFPSTYNLVGGGSRNDPFGGWTTGSRWMQKPKHGDSIILDVTGLQPNFDPWQNNSVSSSMQIRIDF